MNPRIPHHKVVMIHMPQLYLRVKHPLQFFVSYILPLHSSTNQELFKKYLCNQRSHYEKYGCPSYHLKLKYPLLFSVSFVQLVTQQHKSRTVEKHLCNQGSHYEKCGQFPLHKGSHYV